MIVELSELETYINTTMLVIFSSSLLQQNRINLNQVERFLSNISLPEYHVNYMHERESV